MRKRITYILLSIWFLCVACLLAGCDSYTEEATEGAWKARISSDSHKAFVYSYTWDGTEEGMRMEAPEEIAGCKVERYGGFYGRGVPMQFAIELPDAYLMEKSLLPEDAELQVLTFTLVIRKGITNITISSVSENYCYSVQNEDGSMSYYEVRIKPELDPENTKFTMYFDRVWEKDYKEQELSNKVEGFYYEPEDQN